jgi:ParB family chromosome partitioning protein
MSKHGLGRGLEALLGDDGLEFSLENINAEGFSNTGITTVKTENLLPSPYQPRKEFNQEALNALVQSVKEKGVLQPLIVRKNGEKYEIIAGERRWRAAKLAGIAEVPVIEKELTNQEVLEVALVENLLRENLSVIEEAEGFDRLITEFAHTHEALSKVVGKSRSYITNAIRLLSLPESVKNMIKENKLTAGHARALVGLDNAEIIAQKIVDKGLTVRQTEDLVNNIKNNQNKTIAPKKKKDPNLKELEKDLTKKIGMKIKINAQTSEKGKISIEYKNPAELNSILELLDRK